VNVWTDESIHTCTRSSVHGTEASVPWTDSPSTHSHAHPSTGRMPPFRVAQQHGPPLCTAPAAPPPDKHIREAVQRQVNDLTVPDGQENGTQQHGPPLCTATWAAAVHSNMGRRHVSSSANVKTPLKTCQIPPDFSGMPQCGTCSHIIQTCMFLARHRGRDPSLFLYYPYPKSPHIPSTFL